VTHGRLIRVADFASFAVYALFNLNTLLIIANTGSALIREHLGRNVYACDYKQLGASKNLYFVSYDVCVAIFYFGAQVNFYQYFPHLLSDLSETRYKRYDSIVVERMRP
jgi:hypothetical protein